ncbi:hypothetical protein PIB30_105141, partial [Stylosanthes scabra]|nr:hypothetical protein [Stylosanthes scabra]
LLLWRLGVGFWITLGAWAWLWTPILELQDAWSRLGVELDSRAWALSALEMLEADGPCLGVDGLALRSDFGRLGMSVHA